MLLKLFIFFLLFINRSISQNTSGLIQYSGTPGTIDYEEYVNEENGKRRILCVCRRRTLLASVRCCPGAYCQASCGGAYTPVPVPVPSVPIPVPVPVPLNNNSNTL